MRQWRSRSHAVLLWIAAAFTVAWVNIWLLQKHLPSMSSVMEGSSKASVLETFRSKSDKMGTISKSKYQGTLPEWQSQYQLRSQENPHSSIHCIGDNFLPRTAWVYRSCKYRNLCWMSEGPGSSDREWTLVSSGKHQSLEEIWAERTHTQHSYGTARFGGTMNQNHTFVSPIGANAYAIRTQKNLWTPRVLQGLEGVASQLPPSLPNVTGVLVKVYPKQVDDPFELIFNLLLPIYNLLGLFGWTDPDPGTIHVYLLNPLDCPRESCQAPLQNALQEWMGYKLRVIAAGFSTSDGAFCLERAAAGMGALTATGRSQRGSHAKDYSHEQLHNHGRGPLFYQLRSHILEHLRLQPSARIARMAAVRCFFAVPASTKHTSQPSMLDCEYQSLSNQVNTTTFQLSKLNEPHPTASSLIHEAATSNVWVALADDSSMTWPALFLPRGASLILYYNPKNIPKKAKTDQTHPIFPDFDLWNHMSHLQVHWLAIPPNCKEDSPDQSNQILQHLLKSQFLKTFARSETESDWTFNGSPVHLVHEAPPPSKVRCIGENWQWHSPHFRSCLVENLCFELHTKSFFSRSSIEEEALSKLLREEQESQYTIASYSRDKAVMMGQSVRMGTGTPWFPDTSNVIFERKRSFYELPSATWLPFYAEVPNANNPGHLLWDYLLPLFSLLELFGEIGEIDQGTRQVFLANTDSDCVAGSPHSCYNLSQKFLPLLGADPVTFQSTQFSRLQPKKKPMDPSNTASSNLVCAPRALIGMGALTDHGFKKHGQLLEDYQNPWNVGRGVSFWNFRNFMLRNVGLGERSVAEPYNRTITITFSVNSSWNTSRRRDFSKQIQQLEKAYGVQANSPAKTAVRIRSVQLGSLSMEEQLQAMSESDIFISVIGGSTSTAMFLNRNAVLILYFNDIDDFVKDIKHKAKAVDMPAMLDWDFWNHASYLRVHWLPISTMDTVADLDVLEELVDYELGSFR